MGATGQQNAPTLTINFLCEEHEVTKKPYGFNYEEMVQTALRAVVQQALEQMAKFGVMGTHHFYVSFVTNHPGVVMPEYLYEEYPDEMTIVLQHEFWDLVVHNDRFEVTLCFNDLNEHLIIPLEAITSFVDPSVKFGLQFTPEYSESDSDVADFSRVEQTSAAPEEKPKKKDKKKEKKDIKPSKDGSNIVALDSFRKK